MEKQQAALTAVGAIEEAMVKGFPFEVPAAYDNLPQLKVRSRHSGAPKTLSRTGVHWITAVSVLGHSIQGLCHCHANLWCDWRRRAVPPSRWG